MAICCFGLRTSKVEKDIEVRITSRWFFNFVHLRRNFMKVLESLAKTARQFGACYANLNHHSLEIGGFHRY